MQLVLEHDFLVFDWNPRSVVLEFTPNLLAQKVQQIFWIILCVFFVCRPLDDLINCMKITVGDGSREREYELRAEKFEGMG